ncbi:MAG TPA: glycine cleavage system aminomethyltransferase GcvT [Acidimicrobiaceae bacterium]|nr:glycine cleavage system aminomethyltransferase GcvT [Acidimicrobiaceae bacterium]
MPADADLKRTPLWALHAELGARMAPFAGWEMPLRYGSAVAEHAATRDSAGLFDVGHMGVVDIAGDGAAAWLESLVPAGVAGLGAGEMAYTMLTTPDGGIVDDLVVSNLGDRLRVVLNAGRVDVDLAHLRAAAVGDVDVAHRADLATLALQGPAAAGVLTSLGADAAGTAFMHARSVALAGVPCDLSRSGYTGEDGFELIVAGDDAETVARALLADAAVSPVGLAARDSLRLEAGLCLYGSDLDETTTPVEAGLRWSIPKRRRGADAGYPGAAVIARQIADGPQRRRVGIAAAGRRPIRAGATLHAPDDAGDAGSAAADGEPVGHVTSGGFGPTAGRPVAMGYVRAEHASPGTKLVAAERGRREPCEVARLPFVPHRYRR